MTNSLARLALAATTALAACVKIEDGPPKKPGTDTVSLGLPISKDSGGISDPALRPPGVAGDPGIAVHGNPAAVIAALQNDTLTAFGDVDPMSPAAPVATPSTPAAVTPRAPSVATPPAASTSLPSANASDLDVLRREMALPVTGIAMSSIHDTYDELRGGTRKHEALDILAPRGTPVISATNGKLLKLFNSKAGGLMVYAADSSARFILMYAHLDAYTPGLVEGQALRRGQQLGIVGTTGNAPANTPHLHFAIARSDDVSKWWKGTPVDPYPLLAPR